MDGLRIIKQMISSGMQSHLQFHFTTQYITMYKPMTTNFNRHSISEALKTWKYISIESDYLHMI